LCYTAEAVSMLFQFCPGAAKLAVFAFSKAPCSGLKAADARAGRLVELQVRARWLRIRVDDKSVGVPRDPVHVPRVIPGVMLHAAIIVLPARSGPAYPEILPCAVVMRASTRPEPAAVSDHGELHRPGLYVSRPSWAVTDWLRLAVAAYLARFKGSSREHTESDLRSYLAWCTEHGLDPLAARRPHLELYIRWMPEIRRFKPSTVSRRFSVAARFYRTCVLDGILERSPAEHVRRPAVPPRFPDLRRPP
jgi:hypothetical protein